MPEKIIVMGGSFNPPTLAHLKILQSAVTETLSDRGIFVPSDNEYVKRKMRGTEYPFEVLSEKLRAEMLFEMCKDDPRLSVDTCEYTRTERGKTYETMLMLREKNPGAELCFLAGGDKITIISRWHRIDEFLRDFKIAVMKRDEYDPMAEIMGNPYLCKYADRFEIISAPEGIDKISSTAVRDAFRTGIRDFDGILHPGVEKLLIYNKGMTGKIRRLTGSFYFLSNFYKAPMSYGGRVYENSFSAYKAQSCRDADRVRVMEDIVKEKFLQHPELKRKLEATGDAEIINGVSEPNPFWGINTDTKEGENRLGEILMRIRESFKNAENK